MQHHLAEKPNRATPRGPPRKAMATCLRQGAAEYVPPPRPGDSRRQKQPLVATAPNRLAAPKTAPPTRASFHPGNDSRRTAFTPPVVPIAHAPIVLYRRKHARRFSTLSDRPRLVRTGKNRSRANGGSFDDGLSSPHVRPPFQAMTGAFWPLLTMLQRFAPIASPPPLLTKKSRKSIDSAKFNVT